MVPLVDVPDVDVDGTLLSQSLFSSAEKVEQMYKTPRIGHLGGQP